MKLKKNLPYLILLTIFITNSIVTQLVAQQINKPKLVIGIVIDQMRYDYLYRFYPYYTNDGFKKLMNNGTNFTFAHLNYVPSYTAPGHSTIYTGTTPFFHGIISNYWYDKKTKRMIYSVSDKSVKSVGTNDEQGEMSPKRLLTTTIGDQLKLFTNGESKVISLSLKDRAAILPGGHWANGAYWYDSNNGKFITSTYYMNKLPAWVKKFNNRKLAYHYMEQSWKLFRPKKYYIHSQPDQVPYEVDVFHEGKTSFPHVFNNLTQKQKYSKLRSTPFGNRILVDFVKAAVVGENLGLNKGTDFLAISFSSTDYIGHQYGPTSVELEDTYLRLDSQIAELLKFFDNKLGKGNYLLFLTADHGVVEAPAYLKEHNMPVGELNYKVSLDSLNNFAKRKYMNDKIIENYSNNQIFLNYKIISQNRWNIHKVRQSFADYLRETFPSISSIFTRDDLEKQVANRKSNNFILNGFNLQRSGDIAFVLKPGYLMNFLKKGTTHGTGYSYDTHVPMLFYGWHIPNQTISTPVYTVDIAPTITNLLKITEPDGCIGIPLINH